MKPPDTAKSPLASEPTQGNRLTIVSMPLSAYGFSAPVRCRSGKAFVHMPLALMPKTVGCTRTAAVAPATERVVLNQPAVFGPSRNGAAGPG